MAVKIGDCVIVIYATERDLVIKLYTTFLATNYI